MTDSLEKIPSQDGGSGPGQRAGFVSRSGVDELHLPSSEALLVALTKRVQDLLAVVAVPLSRLEPMPCRVRREHFFDRVEVASSPRFKTIPRQGNLPLTHVRSLLPSCSLSRATSTAAQHAHKGFPCLSSALREGPALVRKRQRSTHSHAPSLVASVAAPGGAYIIHLSSSPAWASACASRPAGST